ncbi:hypothetical protein F2Q70_00001798 [Brassica cretica]|uniref:Uncharacterized protein n=1 Tax=Brassica cretica TaxID=69181 RepID=A0A8S9ID45_BRACR|nr:hypothetical protein F2Q68_00024996 [Brassica cretica]KAF2572091.1 hypothetical protein F2Q70_00001798 [Brassica cretica]
MERLRVFALGGRSESDSRVSDAINASDLAVSLRSRRSQLERPYGVAAERRCEVDFVPKNRENASDLAVSLRRRRSQLERPFTLADDPRSHD